jgi:hypothetical protein
MVVTCAFYGFANHTTKVKLEVERDELEVGQVVSFEGDNYIILSVCEAGGNYHANVTPEHVHRARTLPRTRTTAFGTVDANQNGGRIDGRESTLHAHLKAAETRLQHLLRERDEALKRLDRAIQQLDRLHDSEEV